MWDFEGKHKKEVSPTDKSTSSIYLILVTVFSCFSSQVHIYTASCKMIRCYQLRKKKSDARVRRDRYLADHFATSCTCYLGVTSPCQIILQNVFCEMLFLQRLVAPSVHTVVSALLFFV